MGEEQAREPEADRSSFIPFFPRLSFLVVAFVSSSLMQNPQLMAMAQQVRTSLGFQGEGSDGDDDARAQAHFLFSPLPFPPFLS